MTRPPHPKLPRPPFGALYNRLRDRLRVPLNVRLPRIAVLVRLRSRCLEALLKVRHDVVNVLRADRYPDEVLQKKR